MPYALAGYRVAGRTERQDWQDTSLPSTGLVSLSDCVTDIVPVDLWDGWFASQHAAETAASAPDLQVLAVGFATTDVPELLADIADGGWDRSAGSLPHRLARLEPFPPGRQLGFELVGFDSGRWHTWTCLGGLVAEVRQATGVQPGQWGLIPDEQDARRAARWLTESGLGDPKVFLWVAALLSAGATAAAPGGPW